MFVPLKKAAYLEGCLKEQAAIKKDSVPQNAIQNI
jgi:hypothetical protein